MTKKIFSAEKKMLDDEKFPVRGEPSLRRACAGIDELKADIKYIAGIISGGTPILNESSSSSADKVLVDKEEFERHHEELSKLKRELREISEAIDKTKQEIAALGPAKPSIEGFSSITNELDAIAESTEVAAEEILACTENIENIATSIQSENVGSHLSHQAEEILSYVTTIFEACNFQDLTGQRITKAINTLSFVGERINRMVDIWAKDIEFDETMERVPVRHDGDVVIGGPAIIGEATSQDDIDKLFNQADIDKLFD